MRMLATWVDASYVVHMDKQSQTGGCIGFEDGKGVVHSQSTKQRINTKSSNEAKFVDASD